MKRLIVITVLLVLASGCGGASRALRSDMEASKAEYKECLRQHPNNLPECETAKRIFGADLDAYRAHRGQQTKVKIEK